MNIRNIEVGMKIRINRICHKIETVFGLNIPMENLRGTVQVVKNVRDIDINKNLVRLRGWSWHIDDLSEVEVMRERDLSKPLKEIKPETFNPNQLIFD